MENKTPISNDDYMLHSDDPFVASGEAVDDDEAPRARASGAYENFDSLEDEYPLLTRVIDAIEEHPTAAAAAAASAAGVLVGAGLLTRRAFHRETTMEKAQAMMCELLNDGATILATGKKRGREMGEQAASVAEDYGTDAAERLDSLGKWFKRSASQMASDLPNNLEKIGKTGIDAVARAVEKQPAALGTLALAATAAFGAFLYTRNSSSNGNGTSNGSETREALYAQAKKLGIEGRSSMSKQQLRNAIRTHKRQ